MASEHVHVWVYVADESAPVQPGKYIALNMKLHRFCTECDVRQELLSQTVLDEQEHKIRQLEQQLAQAREELAEQLKKENTYLPFLVEQNKQFEEWMHQARALLEEVAGKIYPAHWKGTRLMYCDLCNEHGESVEQIEHRAGCLAAKARAFLDKEA